MSANTLLQALTQALFVLVFVLVALQAVRQPRRARLDTALFFGDAALLIAEGWLAAALHWHPSPLPASLLIVLVLALPYLLLRLVDDFAGVARPLMRGATVGLVVLVIIALATTGHSLPAWLTLLYVLYFVGVTLYGAIIVVRAARRARGVTRRRLQAVAAGSLGLGMAILCAGVAAALPAATTGAALLSNACALGAGLGYVIGFAPPRWLRDAWRGPELRAFLARASRASRLPDTATIARELAQSTAAALGTPGAMLNLWDAQAGVLRDAETATPGATPALLPVTAVGSRAFTTQRALFVADTVLGADGADTLRAGPEPASGTPMGNVRAALAAPVTAGETRLGVLVAYAPAAPLFAEDDLVLLHLLADQAAVILENRLLLDAMAQASQAKSQFLAAMSHELRTPLNAIIGFSEVLQDSTFGALNERQHRYVGNVLEAGRHLLGLINDILDISKVEAGQMELHPETLRVDEVLANAQRVIQPLASQKGIVLRLETPAPSSEGGVALTADRARLLQILYNLLSNAVKFTPSGGTVTLSSSASVDAVAIVVRDTGIGIAPSDQARIFEEFAQVDSATTRQQQGTGLGLALTRRLVELHGGSITVQSAAGQGSSFTVTLPRAGLGAARDERETQRGREELAGGNASGGDEQCGLVLVVEDRASARELLRVSLSEAGYGVAWVDQLSAVLPRARELQPVAITLDILMGDDVAWPVLQRLKADPVTRQIPVVIVSIVDEPMRGFALGASAYLVKPVARSELIGAIERAASNGQRSVQVLAVDDQPDALELIALALAGTPHALTRAHSGAEALRVLAERRPDVLIVDLMMEPMSGFDVIAAVAGDPRLRTLPIIVLTNKDLTAQESALLNGHILSALSKHHFDKALFLAEVRRATRQAAWRPSEIAETAPR